MMHDQEKWGFDWEAARRLGQALAEAMPRVRVEILTVDQVEMVRMLGGDPEAAARTTVAMVRETMPGSFDKAPHIVEHDCPIIERRGRLKAVLPDGDLNDRSARH